MVTSDGTWELEGTQIRSFPAEESMSAGHFSGRCFANIPSPCGELEGRRVVGKGVITPKVLFSHHFSEVVPSFYLI